MEVEAAAGLEEAGAAEDSAAGGVLQEAAVQAVRAARQGIAAQAAHREAPGTEAQAIHPQAEAAAAFLEAQMIGDITNVIITSVRGQCLCLYQRSPGRKMCKAVLQIREDAQEEAKSAA